MWLSRPGKGRYTTIDLSTMKSAMGSTQHDKLLNIAQRTTQYSTANYPSYLDLSILHGQDVVSLETACTYPTVSVLCPKE